MWLDRGYASSGSSSSSSKVYSYLVCYYYLFVDTASLKPSLGSSSYTSCPYSSFLQLSVGFVSLIAKKAVCVVCRVEAIAV